MERFIHLSHIWAGPTIGQALRKAWGQQGGTFQAEEGVCAKGPWSHSEVVHWKWRLQMQRGTMGCKGSDGGGWQILEEFLCNRLDGES